MKKVYWIIGTLIKMQLASAQLNNNNWLIGGYPPTIATFFDTLVTNTIYNTSSIYFFNEGYSNVSNSNISISCNPYFLFNKDGELIENGEYLANPILVDAQNKFSQFGQASIILPKRDNEYYTFVCSMTDQRAALCGSGGSCVFNVIASSVCDLSLNNNKGKVIHKDNIQISNDSIKGALTACRHGNGKDWWVIVPHNLFHAYYKLLVTPDSIYGPYYQDLNFPNIRYHRLMQASFSQDGTLYTYSQNNEPEIILDRFDRCTGLFSAYQIIHPPIDTITGEYAGIGNCFSPNNQFLYITSGYGVYQYEIATGEFVSLMTDSINHKGNTYMQYGADGKIYIGNFDKTDSLMSYIRYPDRKGKACGLCVLCYATKNNNASSPPNMPNYELGALKGSPCDTIGKLQYNTITIYPNPATNVVNVFVPLPMNTKVEASLYNLLGQRIANWSAITDSKQEVELSLKYLALGLYTIKIEAGGDSYIGKLLIE
jgi:hypothetical protein